MLSPFISMITEEDSGFPILYPPTSPPIKDESITEDVARLPPIVFVIGNVISKEVVSSTNRVQVLPEQAKGHTAAALQTSMT